MQVIYLSGWRALKSMEKDLFIKNLPSYLPIKSNNKGKKMKLFNLLAATTLTLASVAAPAFAGVYRFNKYAGNIYVNWVDVYPNRSGGTTAQVNMNTPRCNSNYALTGNVKLEYYSPAGGYFVRNIRPRGNDSGSWYASTNLRLKTNGGRVYITDQTYCVRTR